MLTTQASSLFTVTPGILNYATTGTTSWACKLTKEERERERERGAERCREAEISVNGLLLNIVKEEIVGRDWGSHLMTFFSIDVSSTQVLLQNTINTNNKVPIINKSTKKTQWGCRVLESVFIFRNRWWHQWAWVFVKPFCTELYSLIYS